MLGQVGAPARPLVQPPVGPRERPHGAPSPDSTSSSARAAPAPPGAALT